jgi:hypothetical protein
MDGQWTRARVHGVRIGLHMKMLYGSFRSYLGGFVLVHTGQRSLIEPGLHISYATKNGGPVRKTETGWRNWNGFLYVRITGTTVWFCFRRRTFR